MLEAGTVLHLARSGRLIVKASSQVPDGALLVDDKGRRAGKVMETIGPVSSPYLSVQPGTDRTERIVGTKLFISESLPSLPSRGKKFNRFRSNKKNNQRGSPVGQSRKQKNSRR
ncbi:MAG: H/ACA ribonucleoprotein complex subunit GAR1 [Nitrososphaerales archaeon]